MIGAQEAARRIAAALTPVECENIDIAHLAGRVLGEDAIAKTGQPPFSISTVIGFAVRLADGDNLRNLVGQGQARQAQDDQYRGDQ